MKKYLWFVAVSAFLFSCADDTRDNPYDERAVNYIGKSSAEGSLSSVETDNEPFSSSTRPSSSSRRDEDEDDLPEFPPHIKISSSSAWLSSSGVAPSSSSSAPPSSSSIIQSSSSVEPSSSSAEPSSSSAAPSSSSVVPSSSSAPPSSSSVAPSSSSAVPSSSSAEPSSSSARSSSSGSGGGGKCAEGTMCLWNEGGDCGPLSDSDRTSCEYFAWVFKGGNEGKGTLCKGGTFINGCGKNNNPPTTVITSKGCCKWETETKCWDIFTDEDITNCRDGSNKYWFSACPEPKDGTCPK